MIVGALRPPIAPPTPLANAAPLLQPLFGSWQLAQEIVSSLDSRGSKYSCLPRAIFAAVGWLSAGHLTAGRPFGTAGGSSATTVAASESATSIPIITERSRKESPREKIMAIVQGARWEIREPLSGSEG